MKKSRVCALGLACFLGAVTAFSALAATSGGGRLLRNLSDNYAHSGASLSGQNKPENLTQQEQLFAGTLEFDPENDPVIYTTDYGLDIRWHMAGLPANSADMLPPLTSGKFTGYAYINHNNVNWAIIGYSSKSYTLSGSINVGILISYYSQYSNSNYSILKENNTDAASAIYNAHTNQSGRFWGNSSTAKIISALFPNAVPSAELEGNEVLCFAQGSVGETSFNPDSNGNYTDSTLQTYINNYYNSYMTGLPIVEKTLKTYYHNNSSYVTTKVNAKMFPLAGYNNTETYFYGNYLSEGNGGNIDIEQTWFLRSGIPDGAAWVYCISSNGNKAFDLAHHSQYVRPAFVLKIT